MPPAPSAAATLAVLDRHRDRFRVVALTAYRDAEALAELETRFRPSYVALADDGVDVPSSWRRGADAMLDAA
ncbi:MAG: hypothetical protein GWM90_32275, partial [Gemmatimonadetes bacterium]|nr:hypothetical protein [Gemmatimonadota bacterium]NIQ59964.1 hypothetical protein [Gemmatimonadota bacterium]NIU80170.1 hypothetical protein [Gammaproteobacteria bacterium]NIX48567.1 hypothetical protein [Gemmatimonadota bacterium]NIY13012.1 hypothetical protein [Gemmatimonadota bacterium]